MHRYEYKVVPAPNRGTKARGVKTPEGRFANSLEAALNAQAGAGWEYVRAELLPSEERTGLTGSTTNWRNVLVFRRLTGTDADTGATDPATEHTAPTAGAPPDRPQLPEPPAPATDTKKLITVSGMFSALSARQERGVAGPEDEASASDEGLVADRAPTEKN